MKKIPTLFKRIFEGHNVKESINELSLPGLQVVLDGKAVPTIKWDGTAVLNKRGQLYCRYDAKHGKTAPECAIPCCEPDPVTGHWPHWIPAEYNVKQYKWQIEAFEKYKKYIDPKHLLTFLNEVASYEVIGPHFQANPYNLDEDRLIKHGTDIVTDLQGFDFDSIKQWLQTHAHEGIVFWYNNEPLCKVKAGDFGINWRAKRNRTKEQ